MTTSSEPRLQHYGHELKRVAKILKTLNKSKLGLSGTIQVYWCDLVMGEICNDEDVWVYYPTAAGETPEKETKANTGKEIDDDDIE